MKTGNVTLSVVIKGANGQHVAREFVSPRERQTFVEGREGSSFALRIRNDNPFRIVAIVSVDGLSTIGGERATPKSPGYVVEAHGTFDVPGWKVDSATAAEFFFAASKDVGDESYAVQMGHGDQNKGTIGLIAYREDVPRRQTAMALAARTGSPFRGMPRGGSFGMESMKSAAPRADAVMLSSTSAASSPHEPTSFKEELPEKTLGTGFGKAVGFETTNVAFRRGALVAQMEIWYENRRGLKRFGIDVDRPAPARRQAFDVGGDGCPTPPGWSR